MSHARSQVFAIVIGAAAAAVASLAAWHYAAGPWREDGPSVIDLALQRRQELRARYEERQAGPAAPVAAALPHSPVRGSGCAFEPVLPPGTADDGQFSAKAAAGMQALPEAQAFVSVAQEAAARGRSRDAEAAYVTACRVQAQQAPGSAPLADIEAALARHYVDVARQQMAPGLRAQALGRARDLLDEAARLHAATPGPQAMEMHDDEQPLRTSMAAGSDSALEVEEADAARVEASPLAPGEDRAHSEPDQPAPDAIVQGDPELAQLESDLQRLRNQAENVSEDPAGMHRRVAEARARRQHCHDRECLRRWYAQRRQALLDEF